MSQLLTSLPQFAPYLPALKKLGYTTLEQLIEAAKISRTELESYLQTTINPLLTALPFAAAPIPASHLKAIETAVYATGVDLDRIPAFRGAFAAPFTAADLPVSINHVSSFPSIRFQADRGTCVAFATVAAFEHWLIAHGTYTPSTAHLSEQFLYWSCKSNDGSPSTPGTYLGVSYPLLKRDGVCEESLWPYVGSIISGNEGQGPPPQGAQLAAASLRLSNFEQIAPTSVQDIKTVLASDRCVSFTIPVFNSWINNRVVRQTGDIVMPFPGESIVSGHAMCFVGYRDDPTDPGGGRFLIRNSWNSLWGLSSSIGIGYGTIPYAYVASYGREAYAPSS